MPQQKSQRPLPRCHKPRCRATLLTAKSWLGCCPGKQSGAVQGKNWASCRAWMSFAGVGETPPPSRLDNPPHFPFLGSYSSSQPLATYGLLPPPPEGLMHDTAAQSHPSLNRRRPRGHLGAAHFPRVEWVGGSWLAFELHQEGAWPSPLSLPLTVSDAWRPTGPSSHWWGLMEPPKPDSRMPEGNCGTFENGCKLSGSEDSTALENHPGGGVGVGGASLSLGHVDSWKEAWAGYPQPPVVQPPA